MTDTISPETLAKAGELEVYDENEKKVKFSTLFEKERTMVIFIRHFLCGNCMVLFSIEFESIHQGQC